VTDRTLITPMILGSVLNPINSSMLAVALIPIGRTFGASPAQTAWLVTALYLATAVGQPVIGRLVDSYGPRRPSCFCSSPSSTGRQATMAVSTLDPTTALVVIDLQKGVVALPGTPHATPDVVARTAELAAAFRERGLPVVLVRVSFAEDGGDVVPGRTQAPPRTGSRPKGWDEIVEDLAGDPRDIVVTKRNWSAFYGTDLDLQLRRRGVTQIVLTGVATSIGVDSTARGAYEHGYHVTVATDAVTDMDDDSHRHSTERIFPRLGETGTTAEILDLLAKSATTVQPQVR
jgi:nicotinamidase-related amidase